MSDWSAEQYSKFENDRTLPSIDLANAIVKDNVRSILDIGCGIGNSSAAVKNRFPQAEVIGVDNSGDMLETARKNHPDIKFFNLDASTQLGSVNRRFDVVFSNACIQWLPDHPRLLADLMRLLNDGGVLAVQIPQQYKHPMHGVILSVAESEKWREKVGEPRVFYNLKENGYFDILSEISSDFRIWETVYMHRMPSHRSIVEWYKGTSLRPFLAQLSDSDKADFERDVLCETKKVYPVQKNGEIIFRFPRLFFTAVK